MKLIRPFLQCLLLAVFSSQCSTTKSPKPPAGGSVHLYMHKWVLATTRMACVGTNVENEFLAALSKVNDWRYRDYQLLFYHDNDLQLRLNAAVNQPDAASQLNGTWELNYITDPRIAFDGFYPKQKPQLIFTLPKEEVGGNTSCNVFGAPFKLDGSKISFGDGRTNLMACEGSGGQTFMRTL